MALFYPIQTPSLPLKWDEQLWTAPIGCCEEFLLLRILSIKQKTDSGKELLSYWSEKVVGLRTESDDEEHDTDE
ncbi:unnamed protein product [Auanema sp. JU1783]|nr:unnamed protein product [Auanema sp. JU1783]